MLLGIRLESLKRNMDSSTMIMTEVQFRFCGSNPAVLQMNPCSGMDSGLPKIGELERDRHFIEKDPEKTPE